MEKEEGSVVSGEQAAELITEHTQLIHRVDTLEQTMVLALFVLVFFLATTCALAAWAVWRVNTRAEDLQRLQDEHLKQVLGILAKSLRSLHDELRDVLATRTSNE